MEIDLKAKELERLLVRFGASPSSIDLVTRSLRAARYVRTSGRGMNAPEINPLEAAYILLASAGSDKPYYAERSLARLLKLRVANTAPRLSQAFYLALEKALSSPRSANKILEFRVCRNHDLGQIRYLDGYYELFLPEDISAESTEQLVNLTFRSEGVLSGGFLNVVAEFLSHDR